METRQNRRPAPPGAVRAFARFALLGGGVGVTSGLAVAALASWTPWVLANALVTVASTLLATELHARFTFGAGRPATRRQHAQSAGSAAAAYTVTCAAMLVLQQLVAAPGALLQQAVYLSASALAGVARFAVLRLAVFAHDRPRNAATALPAPPPDPQRPAPPRVPRPRDLPGGHSPQRPPADRLSAVNPDLFVGHGLRQSLDGEDGCGGAVHGQHQAGDHLGGYGRFARPRDAARRSRCPQPRRGPARPASAAMPRSTGHRRGAGTPAGRRSDRSLAAVLSADHRPAGLPVLPSRRPGSPFR